jgi:hypothetical protein
VQAHDSVCSIGDFRIVFISGSIGQSSTTVQHQVQTPRMQRFLTLLAPEAVAKQTCQA